MGLTQQGNQLIFALLARLNMPQLVEDDLITETSTAARWLAQLYEPERETGNAIIQATCRSLKLFASLHLRSFLHYGIKPSRE